MLRQVIAVTAVTTATVALLAGCSDGGDKPSAGQSPTDGPGQTSSSPSVEAPTPYDPPKAFQPVAATALTPSETNTQFDPKVGMVGTTAVANSLVGATGHGVTGSGRWQTLANEATDDTVEVHDASRPMAVQVDGKPAVAVAYYRRVKGSGTTKPVVEVLFRWLDPADGKPMSEATIDVTPLIGDGELNTGLMGGFTDEAVDPATGQVAFGLAPASLIGAKSGVFTVFADPVTTKTSSVPFLKPAGIRDGVIVGAQGKHNTQRSLALVNAASGKVTKSGLLPGLEGLNPTGGSGRFVYLYGQRYDKNLGLAGDHVGYLFAVDPATGAVVQTKSAVKATQYLLRYTCQADGRKTVVCAADRAAADEQEIVGFDDSTGKKLWGYTEKSAGRVVPEVNAVFHGLIYGTVEDKPVLMDALTGRDVPAPAPTTTPGGPSGSASPTDGATPADGVSPAALNLEPRSPEAVSEYGGAYLHKPQGVSRREPDSLQVLKAIG